MRKSILLIILIALNKFSFANNSTNGEEYLSDCCIHSSYTYGGLGLGPLPIPALTLSLGRRAMIKERGAIDVGATLVTLIRWNVVCGYVNGIVYFNQNPYSQYYVGFGGTAGIPIGFDHIHKGGLGVAPNLLVGKEFYSCKGGGKRFFQGEILYPVCSVSRKKWINEFPLIILKYGVSF